VDIQEDQSNNHAINVSITGLRLLEAPLANVFGGTYTGFPNSSATNWLWGGTHWYKLVLHRTSDKCHATDQVGPPPGCDDGAQREVSDHQPRSRAHLRLTSSPPGLDGPGRAPTDTFSRTPRSTALSAGSSARPT
jgi:hypothetical protein